MNKQALQERADSLQTELDQLKALIDKPSGPWKPKSDETYWSYMHGLRVREHQNHNQQFTDIQLSIGDCFRTEEQAQAALDRQKLKTEIINTIAEINDGWMPDWSDFKQEKHYPHMSKNQYNQKLEAYEGFSTHVQTLNDNLYLKSGNAYVALVEKYTPEQLTAAYWG